MSIFAKLRMAKKAADKKKAEKAESEKKAVVPYRHTPTHAAVDALSGAPSSWQLEDRVSIRYQNHKRMSNRASMIRNYSGISNATTASIATETSLNTAMNRSSSYVGSDLFATREPQLRLDLRKSQLGVGGLYDNYDPHQYRKSLNPRHGKSPLASMPISPSVTPPTEPVSDSGSSSSSQIIEMPQQPSPRSEQRRTSTNFSRPNRGSPPGSVSIPGPSGHSPSVSFREQESYFTSSSLFPEQQSQSVMIDPNPPIIHEALAFELDGENEIDGVRGEKRKAAENLQWNQIPGPSKRTYPNFSGVVTKEPPAWTKQTTTDRPKRTYPTANKATTTPAAPLTPPASPPKKKFFGFGKKSTAVAVA